MYFVATSNGSNKCSEPSLIVAVSRRSESLHGASVIPLVQRDKRIPLNVLHDRTVRFPL